MTGQAKHTPGPWNWGAAYGHHSVAITTDSGRVIGTVRDTEQRGLDSHGMHVWEQTEEGRANARLVSLAPTMYEYIRARAEAGDSEAAAILEAARA